MHLRLTRFGAADLFSCTMTHALAVIVFASTTAAAQSDVLLFKNGDRLTGEVKFLDRGKVSFDAPATGVIQIEWDEVAQVVSPTTFEVTLESGQVHYGSLREPAAAALVGLQRQGGGNLDLPMPTIVRMTPIEDTILDRIEMNVDLGYSLAKANDLVQTNLGYDFRYRDEQRQYNLSFDAATSNSENDPSSTRMYTNLGYRRFMAARNWDPFGIGQIERNDELGIDRRTTVGGGMSRWLRDTNESRFAFGGGLVYSAEDAFGSAETTTDAEAMASLDFEWFRYDQPELDVSAQLTLFSRLSGSKETRGNFDVSLRWELFEDFFWGFSVYYTFDQQQSATDSDSDYGSFTSLGWKF